MRSIIDTLLIFTFQRKADFLAELSSALLVRLSLYFL